MKYTIFGFSQKKLIEFKLDLLDALILRYFIDFKDTDKMASEIFENDKFYWVDYASLLKAIPIANVQKDRVYRRLKKMVDVGILKHHTKKAAGTYSFYATGLKYGELIDTDYLSKVTVSKTEGTVLKTEGYGVENGEGTVLKTEGYGKNTRTKDYSIKDKSINNSSIKYTTQDIDDVWNDYPKKMGKSIAYKKIPELLKKYGKEQLLRAVTRYAKEAKGKETQFILHGSTFFNGRYEDYLDKNYKAVNSPNNNKQYGKKNLRFDNFTGRENDYEAIEESLLNQNEADENEEFEGATLLDEYRKKRAEQEGNSTNWRNTGELP
ncbi:hypothetical protein [Clostridium intestinale]|uniref:Uncharacterized protein n=1 Tax=Clostridium intestinale TaxID=36845 RepID=A0A7D6VXG5_9CLOT|nr:hypothetical protein [Clostridium intestinale]QLY77825.1 hypothetical protein HZF06_11955 [Clostridium intestinale]